MRKYLNQVHSFQKLASWMRNVLTLLDGQILITRLRSSILQTMQECEMKIYTVPVHSFSAPKLNCRLPNLEGCVAFPRKPPKGMHRCCFRQTLRSPQRPQLLLSQPPPLPRPDAAPAPVTTHPLLHRQPGAGRGRDRPPSLPRPLFQVPPERAGVARGPCAFGSYPLPDQADSEIPRVNRYRA